MPLRTHRRWQIFPSQGEQANEGDEGSLRDFVDSHEIALERVSQLFR